ncbi:DsbA family protein [Streptomyces sp. NBC_01381]|uniref:DsbA family protein n=1 Tax=Streptomyces sp. NBC_01381 TaxID=2903845 RepID=UPI00224C8108|nr:thioredoxin domain-containing protein [Streptomyces sp. NBC_01381]MCX4666147.1 DsbA family protein [Streptomyces sp. NBC_01381]
MAVRKAGRIAAAVAATALVAMGAAACGPEDITGNGGSSVEESAPASDSSGGGGADAKAPSADTAALADVPASVKGGVITVGDPQAGHTVKLYEDARCPICKKFEETGAQALVKPLAEGKVKVQYTLASFLDKNLGGHGSVNAANALRASVDAGKFPQFHAAVFANQPESETEDAYTPEFLLKIAGKVDGLRGPAFDKAVKNVTYKKWVGEAMQSFTDDGMQGTPSVFIDGEKPDNNALFDKAAFAKELKASGIS